MLFKNNSLIAILSAAKVEIYAIVDIYSLAETMTNTDQDYYIL